MRTILAVYHAGIEQAIQGISGVECLCLVTKTSDLKPACEYFEPDLLLVSTRLPQGDFFNLTPLLCELKKQFPNLRIILLAGEQSPTDKEIVKRIKQLIKVGIYDVHLTDQITVPILESYVTQPKDKVALQQWLKLKTLEPLTSPLQESKRQPTSTHVKLPLKTPKLPSFKKRRGTNPLTSFQQIDWKCWGGASVFFLIGACCFTFALKPILTMNEDVSVSLEEWEQIQDDYQVQVQPESSEQLEQDAMLLGSKDEALIGVLQLTPDGTKLPVRIGISDEILNKGVGLDDVTTLPNERGNTVIYGHREEIFWGLKDLKLNDIITLQMLEGTLSFQVVDLFVVEPDDEKIYQSFDVPALTLVTCYPFIYMGPALERYVVVATLIEP